MPMLARLVEPVVVTSVHVLDGGAYEGFDVQIVQGGERDRPIGAAYLFHVASGSDPYAALLAEHVGVLRAGVEAVAAGLGFAGDPAELFGLDADRPVANLPTIAAIALARTLLEVDLSFVLKALAVTASVKGLRGHRFTLADHLADGSAEKRAPSPTPDRARLIAERYIVTTERHTP